MTFKAIVHSTSQQEIEFKYESLMQYVLDRPVNNNRGLTKTKSRKGPPPSNKCTSYTSKQKVSESLVMEIEDKSLGTPQKVSR